MIVVDTNVIGYLFLSSEQSLFTERALKKDSGGLLQLSGVVNFAMCWPYTCEKTSSSWSMPNALELLRGREYEVSSHEVLSLASKSRCSAYDCEFIAVANDLKVSLLTCDKQLLQKFPAVAISLSVFCE